MTDADWSDDGSDARVLLEFHGLVRADRAADGMAPLADYLARFPEHQLLIAKEFLSLHEISLGVAPAGQRMLHGRYTILGELGHGGQGVVLLARDEDLGRQVAIKLLHGGGRSEALRREARAASRLNHPAICKVIDVGEDDLGQGTFIVMEFVRGLSLDKLMGAVAEGDDPSQESAHTGGADTDGADDGAAPDDWQRPERRVALMRDVAAGVAQAHAAGVVHRDLKPSNVIVQPDGTPKVIDFGLARDEDIQLTLSGQTVGTPKYMAPEQVRGEHADARADVHALGTVLHELLTGFLPWRGTTKAELERSVLHDRPPLVDIAWRHSLRDLRAVLEACLAKDRAYRYLDAQGLADDLDALLEGRPVSVRSVGRPRRVARWMRAHKQLVATWAVALVIAAGVVAYVVELERDRRREMAVSTALSSGWMLDREVDELHAKPLPPLPASLPALERQIAFYEQESARIGELEALLDQLRRTSLPLDDAGRADEERARLRWRTAYRERSESLEQKVKVRDAATIRGVSIDEPFRSRTTQFAWQYKYAEDSLRRILEKSEAERLIWRWEDPTDAGLASLLETRLDRLQQIDRPSSDVASLQMMRAMRDFVLNSEAALDEPETAAVWERALTDIANLPCYAGVDLVPQADLYPLGRDPHSGLWEFAHLATGALPQWDDRRGVIDYGADDCIVLVLIPGGTFCMGAAREPGACGGVDDQAWELEQPVHEVTLDPFFLGKYEVTQFQWMPFMHGNRSHYFATAEMTCDTVVSGMHPIESVSFDDALEFTRRCGLLIPTEAQWEYAARAGTTSVYWFGDDPKLVASLGNLRDASYACNEREAVGSTEAWDDGWAVHAPTGSFPPNGFGLHDMLGNVYEHAGAGFFHYRNDVAPGTGARLLTRRLGGRSAGVTATYVTRGGSFRSMATMARSASRHEINRKDADDDVGLRVSRPLVMPSALPRRDR